MEVGSGWLVDDKVKSMEALTSGLGRVGAARLPGWGPRDPPKQWLETIGDLAQCHRQWRSCIRNLTSSV